uniref:Uncharacterized protein n=1 Tax=Arion vulgaris TaxID=1028688 RepID=A0A0B6YVQ0_9EUPU
MNKNVEHMTSHKQLLWLLRFSESIQSTTQYFPPLAKHVQIQLREYRKVGYNNEAQIVVIAK